MSSTQSNIDPYLATKCAKITLSVMSDTNVISDCQVSYETGLTPTSTLKRSNVDSMPKRASPASPLTRNLSVGDLSLKRPAETSTPEKQSRFKHTSSGKLRHSSDSRLYSAAYQRKTGRGQINRTGSFKNAEFPLQAGTSLCFAQRAGAGGIRALIESIINKSSRDDVSTPEEKHDLTPPVEKTRTTSNKIDEGEQQSREEKSAPTDDKQSKDKTTDQQTHNPPTSECDVLSRWAFEPYYRVVIKSSGGITAVIQAMRAHPSSADLQAAGCKVFANLCAGSVPNQKAVHSEGGLNAIQDAMRLHPTNGAVQRAACNALRSLNVEVDKQ